MKVKIKPWEQMEQEYGLTLRGNINCEGVYVRSMEDAIPPNRVIQVETVLTRESYHWYITASNNVHLPRDMYHITSGMIEEYL